MMTDLGNHLQRLFNPEAADVLVWGLGHSIWIGAIVALLLWIVLSRLPARQTERRYLASMVALLLLIAGTFVALSVQQSASLSRAVTSKATVDRRTLSTGYAAADASPRVSRPAGDGIEAPKVAAAPLGLTTTGTNVRAGSHFGWPESIATIWMIGVAVMLLRVVRLVRGTRVLLRSSRRIDDGWMRQALDELRLALGIKGNVRLLSCQLIDVPAVCGVLWPVLLVPPSIVTGVSTDHLRVILAHELAHIRRWDYLVNLGQLVVESLLFFNPAVWWISRQTRIEREACCDAIAVGVTGESVVVARTLVEVADWTKRSLPLQAGLPAIDGRFNSGSLTDRVSRLLLPQRRPRVVLPWYSIGGFLAISSIVVVGLLKGADEAVAVVAQVAGKVFSPQEQIEALNKLEQDFSLKTNSADQTQKRVSVVGSVTTADGSPVPSGTSIGSLVIQPRAVTNRARGHSRRPAPKYDFRFQVPAQGELHVFARVDGYAFADAGPIKLDDAKSPIEVKLVLNRGFEGRVRLTNQKGEPIADAPVEASYRIGTPLSYSTSDVVRLRSGPDGMIRLPHAAQRLVAFTARTPGYQAADTVLTLKPNETPSWRLVPAEPATGHVVGLNTGKPIANAEFLLVNGTEPRQNLERAQRLGKSGADGSYSLSTLADGVSYGALVHAPGFGWAVVSSLRAGDRDRVIELPPAITVTGKITGALDQLQQFSFDGKTRPSVAWRNPLQLTSSTVVGLFYTPVQLRGDTGFFELNDLMPGTLTIYAGPTETKFDLTKSENGLTINLPRTSQPDSAGRSRPVTVRFHGVRADVPLKGELAVTFGRPGRIDRTLREVRVAGSTGTFDVPVPGQIDLALKAISYLLKPQANIAVPDGNGPFEVDLDLDLCGAVEGRVTRPDGSPCDQLSVRFLVTEPPPGGVDSPYLNVFPQYANGGRFLFSKVVLGGKYKILATDERPGSAASVFSGEFTVDEAHPLASLDLRLSQGQPVRFRVVDPNGHPMPGIDVGIMAEFKLGKWSSGFGRNLRSDPQGIAEFQNVQDQTDLSWAATAAASGKWLGRRLPIDFEAAEQTITMTAGVPARGVVVEGSTGRVIPDAQLTAVKRNMGAFGVVPGTAHTNHRGEFVFEALEETDYQVFVSGTKLDPNAPLVIRGGQKDPVTLSVELFLFSPLRPVKPPGSR